MRRFAKTIVKVLIAYADIVKMEFPEHMKDERIVSNQQQVNSLELQTSKEVGSGAPIWSLAKAFFFFRRASL